MASANPVRSSFRASFDSDGSFSSLLCLPVDQAVDLLHRGPDHAAAASDGEMWRFLVHEKSRTSVPENDDSPEDPIPEPRTEAETPDSDGLPFIAQRPAKRKVGNGRKKNIEARSARAEKLPYVATSMSALAEAKRPSH
ncbi:hypothetical protein Cni_G01277 [Canna indica]|uniref:Uncharacterized protein n=1 Tax=Canna indica TaxID=4628 RepID=A0AAQ3JMA0_9LILI|nr:hypothetical protein Cni_G01277 [Canna indica]